MNNHKTRKDRKKALPSGCSPNTAYDLWHEWGGVANCLQPVDTKIVQEIMQALCNGKKPLEDWEIPEEYSTRFAEVYAELNVPKVTLDNVWGVFQAMVSKLT